MRILFISIALQHYYMYIFFHVIYTNLWQYDDDDNNHYRQIIINFWGKKMVVIRSLVAMVTCYCVNNSTHRCVCSRGLPETAMAIHYVELGSAGVVVMFSQEKTPPPPPNAVCAYGMGQ